MVQINSSNGIEECITPLDGRNRHKLKGLVPYFSDFALNKYRVLVELKYLQKLSEYGIIRKFSKSELVSINRLIDTYSKKEYDIIRKIEKNKNHDAKAVEEFIKERLNKLSLGDVSQMVHFGLTSEDVNNIAHGLMIKSGLKQVIVPEIERIVEILKKGAFSNRSVTMLGRTHGQAAVPTTLGKEFLVYYSRIKNLLGELKKLKLKGKLTGNVGNLNVHRYLFPEINWLKFAHEFVSSFGLDADLVTTQIESYDSYIALFGKLQSINSLLLGLCQDFWIYIMLGYFKQKVIKEEVGSTALPHKVNPIYFEGAEGGFGIANSLFEFYGRKLSYSRLQRDLSDSTVRRSWGIAFGYSLLSYQSIVESFNRIEPNIENILGDLNSHWEVLSEVVQNFLRLKNYQTSYDQVKKLMRGKNLSRSEFVQSINQLYIDKKDKEELLKLDIEKYFGYAGEIVKKFIK